MIIYVFIPYYRVHLQYPWPFLLEELVFTIFDISVFTARTCFRYFCYISFYKFSAKPPTIFKNFCCRNL